MRDLPRIVAETKIGKKVKVEVLRKGKSKTFSVDIDRLKEGEQVAMVDESGEGSESDSESKALGLTLASLTAELRTRYNLDEEIEGVVVTDVDFESDAADKVRRGDVIVEVGQKPVTSPSEVVDRVNDLTEGSDKPVLLLINRGGEMTFRSVRPQTS